MRIFIYEHVTGGGYAGNGISSSILSEGYGMLRSLIADLKAAGHFVTTFLDSRLMAFSPPLGADTIIPISSREELEETLTSVSQSSDAVYMIAPESGQILQRLVECVKVAGGFSLNCTATAIEKASNKYTVYKELKNIGIQVPETLMIDSSENIKKIRCIVSELGFPLIFKPVDGMGCRGITIVKNEHHIGGALARLTKGTVDKYFLAQKFINGTAASISLISNGEESCPISLNKQIINLSPPNSDSAYKGGIVPLDHPLLEDALETAQRTVKAFRGLEGYVGVDMVLTDDMPVVIEVNPRLTTSYIGLRKVINLNLSQAMVNVFLRHELPRSVQSSGYAFFSKVKVSKPSSKNLHKTYDLEEVVSPPFPVADNETAYALVMASSASLGKAKIRFYEARRGLANILKG